MGKRFLTNITIAIIFICNASASINTTVLDAGDNNALPGVNAVLLQLPDSTVLSFTVSDVDGKVSFDASPDSLKSILLMSTGYERRLLSTIDLPEKIMLQRNSTTLQEVEVVGKSIVTYNKDGVISFIPKGVDLNVGNSFEVLRSAPMISFRDGEIYMLGDNNTAVQNILINSKPSSWSREFTIFYLKSLPPESIIRIEVIPNAYLTYGGIKGSAVNFVIKNPSDGILGNASAGIKYYDKRFGENASLLLTYNRDKLLLSGNFNFSNSMSRSRRTWIDYFYDEGATVNREISSNSRRTGISGSLNMQYKFTKDSWLTASFSISDRATTDKSHTDETYYTDENITGYSKVRQIQKNNLGHPDWTLAASYTLITDKKGSNMRAFAFYGREGYKNPYNNLRYEDIAADQTARGITDYDQIQQSKGYTTGGYLLYRYFFPKTVILGFAYDFAYSDYDVLNDRLYKTAKPDDIAYLDHFKYDETLHKFLVQSLLSFGEKFSLFIALSGELTIVNGDQTTMKDGRFHQNYFNLLPLVNFSANFPGHYVSMFYSMGVGRPQYSMLNPYTSWTTPTNGNRGNPEAKGTAYHKIMINYNFLQEYSLAVSGFYSPDQLNFATVTEGDKAITIWDNVGKSSTTTFSFEWNKSFFGGWWRFRPSVGTTYYYNRGNEKYSEYRSQGWTWSAGVNNTVFLSMKNSIYGTLDVLYDSGMKSLGQVMKSSWYSTLSLNKNFNFGGILSLTINPLWRNRNIRYYYADNYGYYNHLHQPAIPSISISYSQRFGNSKVKSPKDVTNEVERRF